MASVQVAGTLAVVAGVASSLQIAALGRLGERIGPIEAGAVAFLMTALGGAAILLVTGRGFSAYGEALRAPWWMWAGGFTGVVIVTSIIVSGPRIGVIATTFLLLVGQFASAAAIDRFGWFGFERVPIDGSRWAGIALVAIGSLLVLRR